LIHRLSLRNEFLVNYPLVIEETHKHGLELQVRRVLFSAEVNSVFTTTASSGILFVVFENHISSLVMILSNISALCKRSDEM
jgi:hypothetical protein